MTDLEKQLLDALEILFTNKHIHPADAVYAVREAEGLGWEGSSVTAWGGAVVRAQTLLAANGRRTR